MFRGVAQLVESRSPKPLVACSSRVAPAKHNPPTGWVFVCTGHRRELRRMISLSGSLFRKRTFNCIPRKTLFGACSLDARRQPKSARAFRVHSRRLILHVHTAVFVCTGHRRELRRMISLSGSLFRKRTFNCIPRKTLFGACSPDARHMCSTLMI